MIKPKKLQEGDTIAFVAPSSSLSSLFPHRVEKAKDFLATRGFDVRVFPTVSIDSGGKSGSVEDRVEDIHNAFLDPEIKAILCTSGGLYCNELLPFLDYELIRNNPKIFCGYSDTTLLSSAMLRRADLITFYGPCVVTEFGEYPCMLSYSWFSFINALTGAAGNITPAPTFTDEFKDWSKRQDLESPRGLKRNPGYVWLCEGVSQGPLVGGCLPSLLQIRGTPYDFDYLGKTLFLDLPEGDNLGEGIPIRRVDSYLTDLQLSGILSNITGLVIGRAFRYDAEMKSHLKDLVIDHMKHMNKPVMYGADIGHSDPMVTLPYGVNAKLDSSRNIFSIDESAVVD